MDKQLRINENVKQMLVVEIQTPEEKGPGVLQVPESSYIKEELEDVLIDLEEKQPCVKEEGNSVNFPVSTSFIKSEDDAETPLFSQLQKHQKDENYCSISRSNHQMMGTIDDKDFGEAESTLNASLNAHAEICNSSEMEVCEDDEEYRNVNHPNLELKRLSESEELEEVLIGLEQKQLCVKEESNAVSFPVSTTFIKMEDDVETPLLSQLQKYLKDKNYCTSSRSNQQMTGTIDKKYFGEAECNFSETEVCEDDKEYRNVNYPNFELKRLSESDMNDSDNEWENRASVSKGNTMSKSFICSDCGKHVIEHSLKRHMAHDPRTVCSSCLVSKKWETEDSQKPVQTTHKSFTFDEFGKAFNKKPKLNAQKRIHTGEKPFCCDLCGHSFSQKSDLDKHRRIHTGDKPFCCDLCGHTFSQKSNLDIHKRIHMGEKPFCCEFCGHNFSRKSNLDTHRRIHTGEKPFCCDLCGKSFSQKSYLDKHRRIHTGESPFSCDVCGHSFSQKSYLDKHVRIHRTEKQFCCDFCGQRFSQKSNLDTHKIIHTGEKPFCCDLCGHSCSRKSDLDKHVRIHTGEKPFCCDLCGHSFSQKSDLDKHKRIHTGEKPFCCDLCGQSFSQKSNLDTHKRIHTGDKPFCCDVCGHSFSRKSDLDKHRRIHTGETPFCCDICGHSFSQKSSLNRHKRVHTGEKPFFCDLCGHSFSRKSHLDTHKKIHARHKSF